MLLDERGHHAARTDAVAPAEERLLRPVLVEEHRAERLRVEAAEVEDVPHLDRDSKVERAAAQRTPVALPGLPQIGEPRLVITSRFDAAEMPAVAIGTCDELSFAQCLVGDDLTREPDRA